MRRTSEQEYDAAIMRWFHPPRRRRRTARDWMIRECTTRQKALRLAGAMMGLPAIEDSTDWASLEREYDPWLKPPVEILSLLLHAASTVADPIGCLCEWRPNPDKAQEAIRLIEGTCAGEEWADAIGHLRENSHANRDACATWLAVSLAILPLTHQNVIERLRYCNWAEITDPLTWHVAGSIADMESRRFEQPSERTQQ